MSADNTPEYRFIAAVAEHVCSTVAGRISDAWRTFPKPVDYNCENDQGRALAIAMASVDVPTAAAQVDQLVLVGAFLHRPGVYLPAVAAFKHPLLGRWAAASFSASLADAIMAGRYAMGTARETPIFKSFELVEEVDAVRRAVVRLAFLARDDVEINVDLEYGQPATGRFGRVSVANGDGVHACGVAQRADGLGNDVEAILDVGMAPHSAGGAVVH